VVTVSFAQPDCAYVKGSLSLLGTGLQFSSDGAVVRGAIAALKAAQPSTRVLLAVGGATYTNFAAMSTQCIRDLVDDFGFDGVDLDYEPTNSNCQVRARARVAADLPLRAACGCLCACLLHALLHHTLPAQACTRCIHRAAVAAATSPPSPGGHHKRDLRHGRRERARDGGAARGAAQGPVPAVNRFVARGVLWGGRVQDVQACICLHRRQPCHGQVAGRAAAGPHQHHGV
jgi:hypothetical protein